MSRRAVAGASALTCATLVLTGILVAPQARTGPAAIAQEQVGKKEPSKTLFGLTRVWRIQLDIAATEYEAMAPAGGFGFPGGPGQPKAKKSSRPSETNLFGLQFPWVQAAFTADGKTYPKVGLRYAGDMTYFVSSRGLRRPFKVEFSRFDDHRFHGLKALQLHSMPLDPAKGREVLAYALFRAVGVPAPRTAFAEVTLTVPGKHAREHLGLYTLVENVDRQFFADRFRTDKGLLLKPARLRGIDYLGEDWETYKGRYQPQSAPTREQSKRVIEFARLVNKASDEQFRKDIGSYLDVDAFLRFLAANALLSNLDGFLGLGHNYYLYLHPQTNQFQFIPGDLEFSLANFQLMGSPEQLMDLSLLHPYPGANKLPDRLLAIKEVSAKYRRLLKELAATHFTREQLLRDAQAIETATKEILAREAKAVAARKEGAGGFGPPGVKLPQPPSLKTFAEKRTVSVAAQLSGKRKGYVPQLAFGPPGFGPGFGPGKGPSTPVNDQTVRDLVKAPAEFEVTLFAAPPKVSYPVAVAAGLGGEVFVAVDEQGSLGRTPGGGRVLRCIDKDGDGKVDEVKVFAKMEHPRGVLARNNSVWVMHPPTLTVFHDDDGDGVADRQEVLVTGLTTNMINTRGGDHTTNGIRMGIDGWIYIGVGDYGIKEAKGKDGRTITLRGGGIVRVRPDGTELEIYATGLRNPFDLAIDPFLNLFTRDNTNDGAGWDTRVSHLIQSAEYGYTQLFANFTDEIMPTLGTFGGGGGTGGLFVQDPRWPERYRNTLFTGDWGRSEVYRHELKKHGPTFDLRQEVFLKVPRATGMDVDAAGRLYVASWRGGEASVYVGPNVGFLARIAPRGLKAAPPPNLKQAGLAELVRHLGGPNAVLRLHTQTEILRRGRKAEMSAALASLAADPAALLERRVAALFTLAQLDGKEAHKPLLQLTRDTAVREFALRALTDRRAHLKGLDAKVFLAALDDESPRVRAQAVISLGRLNDVSAAKRIIPLTIRPAGSVMPTRKPLQNQPDPDRVLPHLAVRTLVSLGAIDACLEALDGPHWRGALWALRYLHNPKAVEGLIGKLRTPRAPEVRRALLATLIRLYHREAEYKGSWWGIRPDSTGPYYDRQEWDLSKRIGSVITSAVLDGDAETTAFLRAELGRHKVYLKGLPGAEKVASEREKESPIVIPKADPRDPSLLANMAYEMATKKTLRARGDALKGKILFARQSCIACHTDADGQTPKGPHLVDIGKRYSAAELVESILKPSAKIAQGYETYTFVMANGLQYTGFVVSEGANVVLIREGTGVLRELRRAEIDSRQRQMLSAMPEGLVGNLAPEQLADLIAYLQSLR
jgi:putative membrane-bound dehydrogenase-like protein